ncbi:MAG: aminomethyl-transferring glycine dehydrogenase subunit GcvPA [Pseudomonadota bacterium]|jgi:glycine dehydrogenase subunit 1|nr:aminomethyl-transferring glycine dehydrogenase subunit GcvPA [Pseudomonadota bacterium]
MPFIPHTEDDEKSMLDAIGVASIDKLFDEIPASIIASPIDQIPPGESEMAMLRLMQERARRDHVDLCFIGAGAYEHHIPSAVWDIVGRGEFLTSYTPYQAEASQGTLQLIYEFQTMISRLTGMEVANASVYDGATALAEAMLMAVRANKKIKTRRILCAGNINPRYFNTCETIVRNQGIEIEQLKFDAESGLLKPEWLDQIDDGVAVVLSYPNFFGGLDAVETLTDLAHAKGALVIALVNPTALAILKPPGEWGAAGADIVVGEGQPLGIPLASGGPYLGFMCCRQAIVRQMPGRIIGRTVDRQGKTGFTLTLQAREQHIRRAKATSNICTNQGLLVTAATIYMSIMGNEGLRQVALACHSGMADLLSRAEQLPGVRRRFAGPYFHESVLKLPVPAAEVIQSMAAQGILPGYDLGEDHDDMVNCLLVNVTEKKSAADLDRFIEVLTTSLEAVA